MFDRAATLSLSLSLSPSPVLLDSTNVANLAAGKVDVEPMLSMPSLHNDSHTGSTHIELIEQT